jgi:uncharacterized membrane protein (GlpM family)
MSLLERKDYEPVVGISLAGARKVPRRDLVIRFVFGAAVATVASLIGILLGLRTGGLMLAFPAILPATLTLIEQEESDHSARDDDLGSVLGALGLVAFGAVAWWLIPRAGAPAALVTACLAWLGTSTGLYFAVRALAVRRRR